LGHKKVPEGKQVLADGVAHGAISQAGLQDRQQLRFVRNSGNPDLPAASDTAQHAIVAT
jgi:hypothetical protein